MPLVLKPGSAEPWTPFRIIQAFIKAGVPADGVRLLPADHAGAGEILRRTRPRACSSATVGRRRLRGRSARRAARPRLQQGRASATTRSTWRTHVELIAASIADNGGRSCVNASGVWVAASHAERGRRGAGGAARRTLSREPPTTSGALLAPFADPRVAERISRADRRWRSATPGAREVRRGYRQRAAARVALRRLHLPPADGRSLRIARAPARQPRVPLSVRGGRRSRRRGDARMPEPLGKTLVVTCADERSPAARAPARLAVRRSAERRRRSRRSDQLGSAARRQPVRASLRPAVVSGGLASRGERVAREDPRSPAAPASMYCGSCLRDNALAAELIARGHDVVAAARLHADAHRRAERQPPTRCSSAASASTSSSTAPLFRHTPRLLDRLWDSEWALRLASKRQIKVDPKSLGELTVSMLRGETASSARRSASCWTGSRTEPRFDIVNLPYTLLIGLAEPLERTLRRPICCTLQGEDLFLDGLGEPYRQQSLDLIREASAARRRVPAGQPVLLPTTCPAIWACRARRCALAPLGINLEGYAPGRRTRRRPFTIGYFARIAPKRVCTCSPTRIAAAAPPAAWRRRVSWSAGYLAPEHAPYLDGDRRGRLRGAGLATRVRVSRRARSRSRRSRSCRAWM